MRIVSTKAAIWLENTENMVHSPLSIIDIKFQNIKTQFG